MAYIQKKKAIPPLANISFPFCDKIQFTYLAPFWSQKGNTVKNKKTMKIKLKQRWKSLVWKYEDDMLKRDEASHTKLKVFVRDGRKCSVRDKQFDTPCHHMKLS